MATEICLCGFSVNAYNKKADFICNSIMAYFVLPRLFTYIRSMITGMLHLHKLAVILFVLWYVIKLIGFLMKNQNINNLFAKKPMRIIEMVVSFLFLATGIFLAVQIPSSRWDMFFIVKIVLVLIAIPLAVIGFKRGKNMLAVLSVLLLLVIYGLAEMHKSKPVVSAKTATSNDAKELFAEANCVACHGENGDLQVSGAKNLQTSSKTDEEILQTIKNGKNLMPAYKSKLSDAQITLLKDYVKSLRK